MPKPNVIVGLIQAIEPFAVGGAPPSAGGGEADVVPVPGTRTIRFADQDPVLLVPGASESAADLCVIELLHKIRKPAFVEINDKRVITRALAPKVTTVTGIESDGEGWFHVRLASSATRHMIPHETGHDREMLGLLQAAAKEGTTLRVTAGPDDGVILDVHPDTPDRSVPVADITPEDQVIAGVSLVSEARAREFIGKHFKPNMCHLPRVNGGCMPFQYPDDFCWAVAQRITEWLAAEKDRFVAGKVWLFGDLQVDTPNKEDCQQKWDFHVASFVRRSELHDDLLVFDPVVSLTDAIPVADWRKKVRGEQAERQITEARVYRKGKSDAGTFVHDGQVDDDLTMMRCALRRRAAGKVAPPPFDHCLVGHSLVRM